MLDKVQEKQKVCSNISILKRRMDISDEQMRMSVYQLARLVSADAKSSVKDVYGELCRLLPDATPEQRAYACRYVCSERRFSGELEEMKLFGDGERTLPGTHGKVAYVRNGRNDEVFSHFLKKHRGAKAHYVSSFADACDAVFSNTCEFCLLPIKNNKDGKLFSFYSMLDRYELKICDVTEYEESSGGDTTEFALVGRRVETARNASSTQRFEFSVINEDACFIGDVIYVSELLGGKLVSVDTHPVAYDELLNSFYFTVDFEATSPLPLALYLNLEFMRFSPIGLYAVKR